MTGAITVVCECGGDHPHVMLDQKQLRMDKQKALSTASKAGRQAGLAGQEPTETFLYQSDNTYHHAAEAESAAMMGRGGSRSSGC